MISKRTRERAALIMSAAACSPRSPRHFGTAVACETFGFSPRGPAARLAHEAFEFALVGWQKWMGAKRLPRPAFAEAHAMLVSGWVPPRIADALAWRRAREAERGISVRRLRELAAAEELRAFPDQSIARDR